MLEKYDVYLRPFNCQRTLHIYLPNDYYQSDENHRRRHAEREHR